VNFELSQITNRA